MIVVKVDSDHNNQVVVKKEKFKLHFSKCNWSTNVGDDSSVEVAHDTFNVNKWRINPKEHKSLLENVISILGLLRDKNKVAALGDYQSLAICLEYLGSRKCYEIDK